MPPPSIPHSTRTQIRQSRYFLPSSALCCRWPSQGCQYFLQETSLHALLQVGSLLQQHSMLAPLPSILLPSAILHSGHQRRQIIMWTLHQDAHGVRPGQLWVSSVIKPPKHSFTYYLVFYLILSIAIFYHCIWTCMMVEPYNYLFCLNKKIKKTKQSWRLYYGKSAALALILSEEAPKQLASSVVMGDDSA